MQLRLFHYKILIISALLLLTALVWLVVRAMPASETDLRRSACLVDGRVDVCLVSGRDTVALNSDSVRQQGVWINRHWWWASCDGRVLTIGPTSTLHADSVPAVCDSLVSLLARKETERKELIYYLRSHGIVDEGYTQIAAYASRQSRMTDSLKQVVGELRHICRTDSAGHLHPARQSRLMLRATYHVSWYNGSNRRHSVACAPVVVPLSGKAQTFIIHTRRLTKPWGVYAVRNVPWGATEHRKIITVRLCPEDTTLRYHAVIAAGNYWQGHEHDVPSLFAVDGAPVFTKHGRFIGIIHGKEVLQ